MGDNTAIQLVKTQLEVSRVHGSMPYRWFHEIHAPSAALHKRHQGIGKLSELAWHTQYMAYLKHQNRQNTKIEMH